MGEKYWPPELETLEPVRVATTVNGPAEDGADSIDIFEAVCAYVGLVHARPILPEFEPPNATAFIKLVGVRLALQVFELKVYPAEQPGVALIFGTRH